MTNECFSLAQSQIRDDLERVKAAGGNNDILEGIGRLPAELAHVVANFYIELSKTPQDVNTISNLDQQRQQQHIQSMFGLD